MQKLFSPLQGLEVVELWPALPWRRTLSLLPSKQELEIKALDIKWRPTGAPSARSSEPPESMPNHTARDWLNTGPSVLPRAAFKLPAKPAAAER